MNTKQITSALISVFNKDGLDEIVQKLEELQIKIYSTGGTQHYIESLGVEVNKVEEVTGYPSILDGRVKTLHPGVFGGILAIRNEDHLKQLAKYNIPTFDLVVVDLYPFEETVANTTEEEAIIEKIDIGGISLIRAAAKNHGDVVIIPSKNQYGDLYDILENHRGKTDLDVRKRLATKAFEVSSQYDTAIHQYFAQQSNVEDGFKYSMVGGKVLRYGENPHQKSTYYGDFEDMFEVHGGKELSFNNLVDVDAAVQLMHEFRDERPTFAILKHTNACGVATGENILEAWKLALAGDPVSAFGGILIANSNIDKNTAVEIDEIFYEVLIAPSFDSDALELLLNKKKRIVLVQKKFDLQKTTFKTLLNGVIKQDADLKTETKDELKVVTKVSPNEQEIKDLLFANKLVKHLKSNTIVLVKNHQMLGMGCGQTSRVDACRQAIEKATHFGFDLRGAVMASDAFFPFPDCVELGYNAGITAVIQPGGSIKDQLSIDYCNEQNLAMVFTGVRHFKH
jgi:phosphoribosylaminoimidazolecarboxamide formyltransferase/IMP cyclohydrolase